MKLLCKYFKVIIAIAVLLYFSSCKTEVRKEYVKGNCAKDGVNELIDKIGIIKGEGLLWGFEINKDNLYNITPTGLEKATGCKIFKASDSCASFLVLDNEIYQLGEFLGGYGVVNAVSCDFDDNGNKDILYAYSWGSGLHRSLIAVFNTETKVNTVIFDTSDTAKPSVDLIVATQATFYVVYSVDIKETDNYADLSYIVKDQVGYIDVIEGKPVYREGI